MIEIDVELVIDDPNKMAILVSDGDNQVWVPRSLISYEYKDAEEGDTLTIQIKKWFALQEGLI